MSDTYREPDESAIVGEDALQQVFALERRTEAMLRDAEAEALDTLDEARARAQDIRNAAVEGARREAQAIVERRQAELDARTRAILDAAARDADRWVERAERHLDEAVEYVLDVVTLRRGL